MSAPTIEGILSEAKSQMLEIAPEKSLQIEAEISFARAIIRKGLTDCYPHTVREAIVNTLHSGLTLDPNFGQAYIFPRDRQKKVAQLVPSYKGLCSTLMDAGVALDIRGVNVFEGEEFDRDPVTGRIHHRQKYSATEKEHRELKLVGCYSVMLLPSGVYSTEFMEAWEIEKIAEISKSEAWVVWRSQMTKKCPLRRHCNLHLTKNSRNAYLSKVLELDDFSNGSDFGKSRTSIKELHNSIQTRNELGANQGEHDGAD